MALRRIGTVRIMHPASSRLILPLPTFPNLSAPDATTPLAPAPNHCLFLDACRVLTNNAAKEGQDFLSRDRAGNDRIPPPSLANTLQLAPGEYFYHLSPPSTTTIPNYPIVTDFAAWNFPEKIPDHWVRPSASTQEIEDLQRKYGRCKLKDMALAVKSGETGCIVTGTTLLRMSSVSALSLSRLLIVLTTVCEAVHIVPRAHWEWFHRNDMTRYNWAGRRTGVNDPANRLALRTNVGRLWALSGFMLFPAPGQGGYMTYVTIPQFPYAEDFHRRWVPISQRVSVAFLYARFAYTIITLVRKMGDPKLDAFPLPEGVKPPRRGGTQRLYVVLYGSLTSGPIVPIYL